jgi:hypothetical protein
MFAASKRGFKVTRWTAAEAVPILLWSEFDLLVFSYDIAETDRLRIVAGIDEKATILQLEAFTYPIELLELIHQAIGERWLPILYKM